MIPKGAKYGNKVFTPKVGEERVKELLEDTDSKTTFLPESIGIIDLDAAVIVCNIRIKKRKNPCLYFWC